MFSRFDTIPECDRQTDRQTHTHTDTQTHRHTTTVYTALSKASHGKNAIIMHIDSSMWYVLPVFVVDSVVFRLLPLLLRFSVFFLSLVFPLSFPFVIQCGRLS